MVRNEEAHLNEVGAVRDFDEEALDVADPLPIGWDVFSAVGKVTWKVHEQS